MKLTNLFENLEGGETAKKEAINSFIMRLTLNPCTTQQIEKFHDYNEFLSAVRKQIFGEFNWSLVSSREKQSLKEQIETDKDRDLKEIYLEAMKAGKEKELFNYLWSSANHMPKDFTDPRSYLTGGGAYVFAKNDEIYARAKKAQSKAAKLIEQSRTITSHVYKDLGKTAKKSGKKVQELKKAKQVKWKQVRGMIFESKETRLQGFVDNGVAEAEKYNRCIDFKYNQDKHMIANNKVAYEDRMKAYDTRMYFRIMKKKGLKVILGFFWTFLVIRLADELRGITMGMKEYYASPVYLDQFAKKIQRQWRRYMLRTRKHVAGADDEAYELSLKLDRIRNVKTLKHFCGLQVIENFKVQLFLKTIFYSRFVNNLKRFFTRKLEVNYLEKTILMIHFLGKINKNFLPRGFNNHHILHHQEINEFLYTKGNLKGLAYTNTFNAEEITNALTGLFAKKDPKEKEKTLQRMGTKQRSGLIEDAKLLVCPVSFFEHMFHHFGITYGLFSPDSDYCLGAIEGKSEMTEKVRDYCLEHLALLAPSWKLHSETTIFWKFVY